jgi:hypothetical protein
MKAINKILCFVFGHKYRIKRKITSTIRELKCSRCKEEFAMSDDSQCVLSLDDEFRELNDELQEEKYKVDFTIEFYPLTQRYYPKYKGKYMQIEYNVLRLCAVWEIEKQMLNYAEKFI